MGQSHRQNRQPAGTRAEIVIPADVMAELDKAPDLNYGRKFEPWEDKVIREYFTVKSVPTIAKILKTTVPVLRRRVRELGL